jgi:hypothetical protein
MQMGLLLTFEWMFRNTLQCSIEVLDFLERWKEIAKSGKLEQSTEAGDRIVRCKVKGSWGTGYIFKKGRPQNKKRH